MRLQVDQASDVFDETSSENRPTGALPRDERIMPPELKQVITGLYQEIQVQPSGHIRC